MSINTLLNTFPSGLSTQDEKSKPSFGLQVARAVIGATKNQREAFKKKLFENRKYSEGNQDISQYLDELEIDGKNMYSNISYKARPIAQKFKNVVVGGYLLKNEYPSVIATSKHIQDRKDKKKSDAEFRMEYGDVLNQLSQEAGVPLTDDKEFTPETKEDADIYFSLNDKEKEELLMQEMVSFALEDNDIESLKNSTLDDQFVAQYHGYYNYINTDGRLEIDYIQPEDIVCENSRFEDMHDASYKGRYLRMRIADLRSRFALTVLDEEKLFGCAKGAIGILGNPSSMLTWRDDYRNADSRPYDDYTVEIIHIWWKTSKVITYTEGKDRYGREVFDIDYSLNKGQTVKSDGRKKTGIKYPTTAYEGFFSASGTMCLKWEEQRNILRKGEDKNELLSPFILFMPYNKGRMLPNSLMSLMIDSIRNMDIAILKIKQLIAKSAPDDYIIDIEGLNALDLGTGELLQPLDIMQIHAQTGRLYWSSKTEDDSEIAPPIRANQNPIDAKMNAYINWYNTELNNIRDYLGVNEFRDGSASSPRTGFKFMQAQTEASNTATWFLYRAYLKSMNELVKQVGIRIWDALNYGEVNKGYLKYLGKENIKFIQSRKDITASSYDISFSLGITDEDKATLEQYINTCLANGSLEMPDALLLSRIKDPLISERMMTYVYNKRRKQKMEEAKANQESASKYAAESGVQVEKAKQESVQMTLQAEQAREKTKGDNEQIALMLKGAMTLIEESFKTGAEIPDVYKPLIELAVANASAKNTKSLQTVQKEQEAEEQQEMMQNLQMSLESGEITEEQAQQIMQEQGMQ